MMIRALKVLLLYIPLLGIVNSRAQSVDVPALQTVPIDAEQIILVTPEHCQLLKPHIPDDSVNYK
jgi:hypothetical protein